MNDTPKIVYIQRLCTWNQKRGRQKKRWIDMIREDCSELHLTLQEATCRTQDRRVWRATTDERLTRSMASIAMGHKKEKKSSTFTTYLKAQNPPNMFIWGPKLHLYGTLCIGFR